MRGNSSTIDGDGKEERTPRKFRPSAHLVEARAVWMISIENSFAGVAMESQPGSRASQMHAIGAQETCDRSLVHLMTQPFFLPSKPYRTRSPHLTPYDCSISEKIKAR